MTTNIRTIRKLRGMTLQELAQQVGTTAQTIQRLETNSMTVSVDWLLKIAKAFDLPPAALLEGEPHNVVAYVGRIQADGTVVPASQQEAVPSLNIKVSGERPMAVKLGERMGPYEAGTILIVDRLEAGETKSADGRDCLVQLADRKLLFRRIVNGGGSVTAFVPYDDQSRVERQLEIAWLAPVTMAVRYLAE